MAYWCDFRFPLESDRPTGVPDWQLRANERLMHRSKQQLHSITRSPRGSSSHQLGLRRVARIFGGQREADGGRDDDRDAVGLKQRLDRRRDRPAHGHRRDEQGYQPRNLHAEAAAGKPVERREHEGRILRRRFVERPQRGEAAVIGQAAGAPRPMALRARAMSRGVMLAPQAGRQSANL
jgi:hypothetical protein